MRVLLDTHTFIWWDSEPERLSENVLRLLEQTDTVQFVSVVSLWEIQIKSQLDKLSLHLPLNKIYESQCQNGITFLPIDPRHVFCLDSLPLYHKDPFDRLIIAQALVEDLVIISRDDKFKLYDVPLLIG